MRDSTRELIERYEERLALMKLENGVTQFEYKTGIASAWTTCIDPTKPDWTDSVYRNFRAKLKPVEMWVWKYLSSGLIGQDFFNKKQPDDTNPGVRIMILMREVTE